MRGAAFRDWLDSKFSIRTAQSRYANAMRLEAAFGSLDGHFDRDGMGQVTAQLDYSTDDERAGRPNPSPVTIDGVLRTGLASLKQSARLFHDFSVEQRSKREG